MSLMLVSAFLTLLFPVVSQTEPIIVHIPTSKAISLAQAIARDEGYDTRNEKVYFFDLLTTSGGKPLLQGYTSIGFYINGNIRSSISISETTGQASDMNSCEIFDYPDLRLFQDEMLKLSKARIKTPRDLADDAACTSPKILKTPESRP